jgi:hypothetical protein
MVQDALSTGRQDAAFSLDYLSSLTNDNSGDNTKQVNDDEDNDDECTIISSLTNETDLMLDDEDQNEDGRNANSICGLGTLLINTITCWIFNHKTKLICSPTSQPTVRIMEF